MEGHPIPTLLQGYDDICTKFQEISKDPDRISHANKHLVEINETVSQVALARKRCEIIRKMAIPLLKEYETTMSRFPENNRFWRQGKVYMDTLQKHIAKALQEAVKGGRGESFQDLQKSLQTDLKLRKLELQIAKLADPERYTQVTQESNKMDIYIKDIQKCHKCLTPSQKGEFQSLCLRSEQATYNALTGDDLAFNEFPDIISKLKTMDDCYKQFSQLFSKIDVYMQESRDFERYTDEIISRKGRGLAIDYQNLKKHFNFSNTYLDQFKAIAQEFEEIGNTIKDRKNRDPLVQAKNFLTLLVYGDPRKVSSQKSEASLLVHNEPSPLITDMVQQNDTIQPKDIELHNIQHPTNSPLITNTIEQNDIIRLEDIEMEDINVNY